MQLPPQRAPQGPKGKAVLGWEPAEMRRANTPAHTCLCPRVHTHSSTDCTHTSVHTYLCPCPRAHAHPQTAHTRACTYTHVPIPTCTCSSTGCTYACVMHAGPGGSLLCDLEHTLLAALDPACFPGWGGQNPGQPVSSQRSVAAPLAAGQAGTHQLCLKSLTAPRSTLV